MTRDASLAGADVEPGGGAGEAAGSETPQLVVVGASAGGVEALTALVGTLPATLSAPLIIAQHLDPRRPSHLREILERRTPLPVVLVEERERLRPGTVYVVPSDRHVDVREGDGGAPEVVAEVDGSRAQPAEEADGSSPTAPAAPAAPALPKPSIDRLLRSAAEVYGEGLIAVVLTGSGSDGTQGARTVKERGGTVIIQNPQTASFPSMPQSLAPATVDVVADLEAMGPLLQELLEAPRLAAEPAEARALRGVLDQLRERSGIDFSAYKEPTILRRLQRRMVVHDISTVTEYARFLQRHPDEHERLVSSFLIKVTGFFRDPELYAYLRDVVVPELVGAARERGRELRFWSAGCATGEEAYSLAILAADVLGDELETFMVRVFATDLDNEAIAFARHGVYPAAALANVPQELVERHFVRLETGEYEIRKRVRALTVFGQHDLGQRAPFPRIDLALCRNVLIYFTVELQRRALQLFAFALREGGYLALGKAETVSPLAEYFSLTDSALKLYRRHRTGPVSIPAARIRDVAPPAGALPSATMGGNTRGGLAGFSRISPAPALLDARAGRGARQTLRARSVPERMDGLVAQLPVGVVVVDRRYDVQSINTAARRLLGIHGAAVGEDFVHLAQSVPSVNLRAAIEETLRPQPGEDGREVVRHVLPVEPPVGEVRFLQISVHPYRHEQNGEALAVVLISDVTALEQARLRLADERTATEALVQRQEQQLARLTDANRQLLQANDELTTINTTLRSANEELLLSHEEVQAATEEVETLNEELQATNEEQETLNEELQATVEELNTTNDDLHSRSLELHELTLALEGEREQLRAVLSSMSDAVLVLDGAGTPMLANEAYEAALGPLRLTARPLEMLGRSPGHSGVGPLAERAATGEPFTMQIRHVGTDGALREYEARGRALSGAAGRQGTVITFREVGT